MAKKERTKIKKILKQLKEMRKSVSNIADQFDIVSPFQEGKLDCIWILLNDCIRQIEADSK